MIIIRVLTLMLFLVIFPIMLGAPWTTLLPQVNLPRMCACLPIGFFVELAVFQLLAVPIACFHLPFTLLSWLFIAVIATVCFYSTYRLWKHPPFVVKFPVFEKWEVFYLLIFIGLFGLQLYNAFVRDTTYWSYDDAVYVTYAADALRMNSIQTIDPTTGIAQAFLANRVLQSSLFFPAFLSQLSSIPVAAMERTILETYYIAFAYITFTYMTSVVFEITENRLIFLIILSLLHIFGWYSQYSITFRLLGPNYQGKAVLAVSLFPFLFTFFIQVLDRKYSIKCGIFLMLLSAAATSLTLFGAVTIILNTTLTVGLSVLRKERQWKHLWYIIWSAVLPGLYVAIYFICKYAVL